MHVITTHLSADFDAFAAAVCSVRLFPGHLVLFPGSLELAVRRFVADTGTTYPELRLRDARRARWQHAVVVDTANPQRLGEAWQLIERDACPVTLIDHHRDDGMQLGATTLVIRDVGATSTIISGMLRERGLEPTPEEASLLLMGIYEDTGGLSYRDTTPQDLREAARLLEIGGSLQWVRRWVLKGLEPAQLELLNRIVEGTEEFTIRDVKVAVSMVSVEHYHEEAAYVVHRWMEIYRLPVGAVMLVRPPHVNLILRSRLPEAHVGRVAELFGGGGHATAASARVADRMPVEIREELLKALDEQLPPPATAADIASHQIFTVDRDTLVRDTKDTLNRLRVNALPVRESDGGGLVGMVTRQILDRSMSHGMGERPVSAVMHPGLPIVAPEAPLCELRDIFLSGSHRFVIVGSSKQPVGLITRMDLFRRLFAGQSSAGAALDHRMAGERPVRQPIGRLLRDVSPPWVHKLLDTVHHVAAKQNDPVYLVGGLVRDLLLGRANEDVDLVVEGDGIAFAEALAPVVGARCHPHRPFMTAVLILPDGHKVDVVSARTEFYRTPAALPEVMTSLIRQDMYRRDFTVNTLAVALAGEHFGELIDFFGGRKDIARREIRVLHSLSFIDDPTRAIRAVRYARRLGFTVATDTRHLIATAVQEKVFDRVSGQRLRRELEQLFDEGHPTPTLAMLAELGLLSAILPDLKWSELVRSYVLEVEGQAAWYRLETSCSLPPAWLLYLGAVVIHHDPQMAPKLADRLQLAGASRERLAALPGNVATLIATAKASSRRSERVHAVERATPEAVLLAMADVDLATRRVLADAVTAGERVPAPVSGAQLCAAGLPPGAHIGEAIRHARDALLDGSITADAAVEFALTRAREALSGDRS